MKIAVRLPSGETLTLERVEPDLEMLKRRIEAETAIPATNQELRLAGSPLGSVPDVEDLELDLIVRVGWHYAIAAPSASFDFCTEVFHPAVSIERARDLELFRSVSKQCRFSDDRHLARMVDLTDAEDRANARLQPYRSRAGDRRARLQELCVRLDAGPLLVMTFNAPYAQLFENWHRSCRQHDIDVRSCTVVFPMDDEAEAVAGQLGYATFFDPESYGSYERSAAVKFGDRQWIDCLFMKNAVMGDMLATGVDVLFQDVDVIWRRSPLPYLSAKADLERWDFMFQKGGLNSKFQPLYYNTGFVYARSNEFSRLTWECVLDNQRYCYVYRSQQAPVNIIMNTFRERGLRTCALEESLFVNGHLVPAEPKPDAGELHPQAFVIHFNWTDGFAVKLDRLRDNGLWYLDGSGPVPPEQEKPARARESTNRHGDHSGCMVSHRLRCIYLAIAKNASSTIKAELRRLDAGVREARCTDVPAELWRDYTTFTFLRDPVSRVLSAYQEISMRLDGKTVDSLPFTKLAAGPRAFRRLSRLHRGATVGRARPPPGRLDRRSPHRFLGPRGDVPSRLRPAPRMARDRFPSAVASTSLTNRTGQRLRLRRAPALGEGSRSGYGWNGSAGFTQTTCGSWPRYGRGRIRRIARHRAPGRCHSCAAGRKSEFVPFQGDDGG